MTYKRTTLTVLLIATLVLVGAALTYRALGIEYGDPRCDHVTYQRTGIHPEKWTPVGWRVEDGYTPLSCQSAGRWWYLHEDGSVGPL